MIAVRGALPGPSGYIPYRQFAPSTEAIGGRPLGAIAAIDQSGVPFQYAGDADHLYENVDGTWLVRSAGSGGSSTPAIYTTAPDEHWEFAVWKNKVLGTNYSDSPQQITFGDTEYTQLTAALRARRIAVIRDFVVFANTFDSTDGEVPSRVRWSAFNDETDYTVSPATLSDFQDLKISKIQRVFGGEYGVILQPDRVWRMSFVGAPVVFQFDEVLDGVGLIAPRAAARAGGIVYFWSNQGLYALEQGIRPVPIGADQVDEFLKQDLDQNYLHRISCVADPTSQRVAWLYPGSGSTLGRPNRMAIFDRVRRRWTILDEPAELLWPGAGRNITLDAAATDTDPDTLDDELENISFDDPRWIGGTPGLAAFDHSYRSGFFDGATRTARIDSAEYEFNDGARTKIRGFRALVNGGSVTAQIGTRNSLADDVVWGPILNPRSEGRFTQRSNARYHRFRFHLSGDWRHAIGFEINPKDIKRGEQRG
ncbi:hypothetical protein GL4_1452 [Methyloceanibacter caenitepidi]|uniref:Phage protein n=1 Tax=Methyloceanibacter caenitepidi TaxID=1384459 RepID=A0A0A8K1T8_9HYPH|nr:hypothetical protein GL4_1452 [Methyloceanibacter caenitepidi]